MVNPADIKYDFFISYAEEDREWVDRYLFDALSQAGLSCLTEAAFELSVPRLVEFERAVQRSKWTLIILSPPFMADQTQPFVDLLAQHFGIEEGKWPVIPVL